MAFTSVSGYNPTITTMPGPSNGMTPGTSITTTTSQGTGTPVNIQTPQSEYSLQLAQELNNIGAKQYGWAQGQAGYLQNLANEGIGQYLPAAAQSYATGANLNSMYNQMYMPAMQEFNQLANNYASAPRQAMAMGQAEAAATQAADQEWQNTQKQLQSMGVDPSSGMYANLQRASNTAAGASAAGAGQQAQQAVQNTGIGLQEQNIGFGQGALSGALGAINTGYQGTAGAVNSGESATNTATNAFQGANQFYNTGAQAASNNGGFGQNTQQTSNTSSVTQGKVPTYDSWGNVGPGGSAEGHMLFSGAQGGEIPDSEGHLEGGLPDSYRRGGHVRRGGRGGRGMGGGGGRGMGGGGGGDPTGGLIKNYDGTYSNPQRGDPESFKPIGGPASQSQGPMQAPIQRSYNPRQASGSSDGSQPDQGTQLGMGPPPMAPPPMMPPPATGGLNAMPSGNSPDVGMQGPPMDPSMGAAGGGLMPPGHQGRPHPPHPYHINGLPDASTGGHVAYELSPSHGHTVDDVVANLNAGEFVLPRRTVHHVGHKFLYDLIAKSDKEMGLHPQPVGAKPLKAGTGAAKAREAAEGQNFLSGGGI